MRELVNSIDQDIHLKSIYITRFTVSWSVSIVDNEGRRPNLCQFFLPLMFSQHQSVHFLSTIYSVDVEYHDETVKHPLVWNVSKWLSRRKRI